jgi:hypothetical protein
MRFLLAVVVHSATVQDLFGEKLVSRRLKGIFPRLKLIWADAAYEAAVGWAKQAGTSARPSPAKRWSRWQRSMSCSGV